MSTAGPPPPPPPGTYSLEDSLRAARARARARDRYGPCTHPSRTVWLAGAALRAAGRTLEATGRRVQASVAWWTVGSSPMRDDADSQARGEVDDLATRIERAVIAADPVDWARVAADARAIAEVADARAGAHGR